MFLPQGVAQSCAQKLKDLVGTKESQGILPVALQSTQRTGGQHPAHTAGGRLEQVHLPFYWQLVGR